MKSRIEIVQGDITKLHVDAIVTAANESLLGGGGVDGAIHRAAGPELLKECRALNGCKTGEAKITKGYRLHAKWVIHTVGPVWHGGAKNEDELLADCYRNSLTLAVEHSISTVAFPCISTGVYRFPSERAASIALTEIKDFLKEDKTLEKVLAVCFGNADYQIYQSAITQIFK
jgi:O-acetyl-ADP-ribose deacetylase (regulator of RNase III)